MAVIGLHSAALGKTYRPWKKLSEMFPNFLLFKIVNIYMQEIANFRTRPSLDSLTFIPRPGRTNKYAGERDKAVAGAPSCVWG